MSAPNLVVHAAKIVRDEISSPFESNIWPATYFAWAIIIVRTRK